MNTEITADAALVNMRAQDIESAIAMFGVPSARLELIPMSEVDEKASLANQARFEPIDWDQVRTYKHMLLAGAKFPPIIVWRKPNGRYVIVDGNHRFQTYKLTGDDPIVGYVIDGIDMLQFQDMAAAMNAYNGRRLSHEESKRHAVNLSCRGLTRKQIVTATGLTATEVKRAIGEAEARRRCQSIRGVDKLPERVLAPLNGISSDVVLLKAAAVVSACGPTAREVDVMVPEINRQRSEADQIAAVEAWGADLNAVRQERRQPRTPAKPVVKELRRHATGMLNFDPAVVALQANGDSDAVKDLLYRAADHMLSIAEQL